MPITAFDHNKDSNLSLRISSSINYKMVFFFNKSYLNRVELVIFDLFVIKPFVKQYF